MQYRRLGSSGLKLSVIPYGSWVSFKNQLGVDHASEIMKAAYDAGVNFFDNAEGYAAGEMKHGPIALIDKTVPIICIAPKDHLFEKTASNIQEAAARGGKIILFSCADGLAAMGDIVGASFTMPSIHPFVTPILYAVPSQLLAYHTAVLKGTDIDQPRNLAKSVTVE